MGPLVATKINVLLRREEEKAYVCIICASQPDILAIKKFIHEKHILYNPPQSCFFFERSGDIHKKYIKI